MQPQTPSPMMPQDDALARLLSAVHPVTHSESLPIGACNGRVLANAITAPVDVPPADNSAMDGYAMRAEDIVAAGAQLKLVGTSLAGQPFGGHVGRGECVRIMTGALVSDGADTVVMQEQTQAQGDTITITVSKPKGNSIRRRGEDLSQGEVILNGGTRLNPSAIALLASVGIAEVAVYIKPTVTVFATGDELLMPGQAPRPGAIYESNRAALLSYLQQFPVSVIDGGIIADNKQALRAAFEQASANSDLIISSGGVSVGDADYVKAILEDMGQVDFWKVAIKPGKPFAFGHIADTLFCGLPGNPVSSYVTFEQLVVPLLLTLCGTQASEPLRLNAKAGSPIRKRPGRKDYQRGVFQCNDDGELVVSAHGAQGSGIMSSITRANCYIVLDIDQGDVAAGETVTIQPFTQ